MYLSHLFDWYQIRRVSHKPRAHAACMRSSDSIVFGFPVGAVHGISQDPKFPACNYGREDGRPVVLGCNPSTPNGTQSPGTDVTAGYRLTGPEVAWQRLWVKGEARVWQAVDRKARSERAL